MKSPTAYIFSIWRWISGTLLVMSLSVPILHYTVPKIPQPAAVITDVCVSSKYNDHYEITFQREGVYRVDQPTFNLCNDRITRSNDDHRTERPNLSKLV